MFLVSPRRSKVTLLPVASLGAWRKLGRRPFLAAEFDGRRPPDCHTGRHLPESGGHGGRVRLGCHHGFCG